MAYAIRLTVSTPGDLFSQENVHAAVRGAGGTVVRMERTNAAEGRWVSVFDIRLDGKATDDKVALAVMGVQGVLVRECAELNPAWQPVRRNRS